MPEKPVYLVGFMGSGKTSVGLALGEFLKMPVIDTDELIEQQVGMKIRDIFNRYGEDYFRKLESDVLHGLPTQSIIITTGGGIILQEKNRIFLKNSKRTIFLDCKPEIVFQRLADDLTRPLLQNKSKAEIIKMYDQRLPFYLDCAHTIIDTSNYSIDEVVKIIHKRMFM